jgi:hypothetical protein
MRLPLLCLTSFVCLLLGTGQGAVYGWHFHHHHAPYTGGYYGAFVPSYHSAVVPSYYHSAVMPSYYHSAVVPGYFGARTPAPASTSTAGISDVLTIIERVLPLIDRFSALRPPPDTSMSASVLTRLNTIDARLTSIESRLNALETKVFGKTSAGGGDLIEDPSPGVARARAAAASALPSWDTVAKDMDRADYYLAKVETTYVLTVRDFNRLAMGLPASQVAALKADLARLEAYLKLRGRGENLPPAPK